MTISLMKYSIHLVNQILPINFSVTKLNSRLIMLQSLAKKS